MPKAGRNEPCPCGSGRKYKQCCLVNRPAGQPAPARQRQVSLAAEIADVREAARKGQSLLRELGVFVLFACEDGDAWLLEVSDGDALRLAVAGEPCPLEIDEKEEVLEIDWGYRFFVDKEGIRFSPYEQQPEAAAPLAPVGRIHAAIRRIRRRFPAQLLRAVHLPPPSAAV